MNARGKWWFPNKPDAVFYGDFRFDEQTGPILEIIGNPFLNQERECDLILGILEDNQKITLFQCYLRKSYSLVGTFQMYDYKSQFCFIGVHFDDVNQIKFTSMTIKYSNIDSFISDYSLIYDPLKKEQYNIDPRRVHIENYCELLIYPESDTLKSDLFFEIQSHRDKSIRDYIELKSILLDFLNFVTSKEVFIELIYATPENEKYSSKVKLLYRSSRHKPTHIDQKVMFKPEVASLLFHYAKISLKFENILTKWFDLSYRLKHVYDLYFGVVYSIDQYDIYRFLMLTTAAEVYHGLKTGKKNTLFVKRIKEIYEIFPKLTSKLLAFKEVDKAAKDIEETRHYYTHYDPKREPNAAKDDKLFWLTKDLQFVLQLCLLKEMGFDNKRIEEIFHLDKM